MSSAATIAFLRERRTDRLALTAIVAGLLDGTPSPSDRVEEALESARDYIKTLPSRSKRDRRHREIITRVASMLEDVLEDVRQLELRGIVAAPSEGDDK